MFTSLKISSLKSATALTLAALIGVAASGSAFAEGRAADGTYKPGQFQLESQTSTVEIATSVESPSTSSNSFQWRGRD